MTEKNTDTEAPAVSGSRQQRIVMWRGTDGMTEPVKVECPNGLWPNYDSDGIQIFENTHFAAEEEAWESIEESILAGISLSGRAVEIAREALQKANEQAADAALEFKQFRKAKTLKQAQAT